MRLKYLVLGAAFAGLAGRRRARHQGRRTGRYLCAAAHLPDRTVCRLRHSDRQRHGTTITRCSMSATAASAASSSSIEECETGYDTKKGVECYEQVKPKKPVIDQSVFDRHHAAADPEGRGRQDSGPVDGLWPVGVGGRRRIPLDLQSAGDLLGRAVDDLPLYRRQGRRPRQAEGQDHRLHLLRRRLRPRADPAARVNSPRITASR